MWFWDTVGWLMSKFVVNCFFPIFIVLLVFTTGLKDFGSIFDFREFTKNILRKFL